MPSSCCPDVAWIQARIDKTKALIERYEDAIDQLSTDATQTYSLDTGQTRISCTKASIGQLKDAVKTFEARLERYQNQLCGGATVVVRPGF